MSNYVKIVNFAQKDLLLPGDPNKKARGAEVDAEYNAIEVASATKIDKVAGVSGNMMVFGASATVVDSMRALTEITFNADLQVLTNKTLTSPTLNTPTINGGSTSNQSMSNPTIANAIINTPTINNVNGAGGSFSNLGLATPTLTNGSATNLTLNNPTIIGGSIDTVSYSNVTLTNTTMNGSLTLDTSTTDAILEATGLACESFVHQESRFDNTEPNFGALSIVQGIWLAPTYVSFSKRDPRHSSIAPISLSATNLLLPNTPFLSSVYVEVSLSTITAAAATTSFYWELRAGSNVLDDGVISLEGSNIPSSYTIGVFADVSGIGQGAPLTMFYMLHPTATAPVTIYTTSMSVNIR